MSGFDNFLKSSSKRYTDFVEQLARMQDPFPLASHIYEVLNLMWRDSASRSVYLELSDAVEKYSVKYSF